MSTILVIDGKAESLKFATNVLQNHGYLTIEANNAAEGIRIAKEEQPNIILMEIQLPGLDGQTTTRLLKANPLTRDIKIIAQASLDQLHQRDKLFTLGVSEFLRNPYPAEALIQMIKHLLQENTVINSFTNEFTPYKKLKMKEKNKENTSNNIRDDIEKDKDKNIIDIKEEVMTPLLPKPQA